MGPFVLNSRFSNQWCVLCGMGSGKRGSPHWKDEFCNAASKTGFTSLGIFVAEIKSHLLQTLHGTHPRTVFIWTLNGGVHDFVCNNSCFVKGNWKVRRFLQIPSTCGGPKKSGRLRRQNVPRTGVRVRTYQESQIWANCVVLGREPRIQFHPALADVHNHSGEC